MKKSTSQTSLKSASHDKTGTRSAVSTTLRRQTTANTVRRGTASTQARPAGGQLSSSATKRQTIASKPPASTNKNVHSKTPAPEPLSGLKGSFLKEFSYSVFFR